MGEFSIINLISADTVMSPQQPDVVIGASCLRKRLRWRKGALLGDIPLLAMRSSIDKEQQKTELMFF